jgi:hypothetical protein
MINKDGIICKNPSIENCTKHSNYIVDLTKVKNSTKNITNLVDIFISPSHTLKNFFINQGINKNKILKIWI